MSSFAKVRGLEIRFYSLGGDVIHHYYVGGLYRLFPKDMGGVASCFTKFEKLVSLERYGRSSFLLHKVWEASIAGTNLLS